MPSAAPRCTATTQKCDALYSEIPTKWSCRCNKDAGHKAKKHETDHGYKWATEEE